MDLATSPGRWFDLGFRAAYDLISPAVTEATASLGARIGMYGPAAYAVLDEVRKLPLKVAEIYRKLTI